MNMSNPLIVCALGASMLTPAAPGQDPLPRYRITDLGDLDDNNNVSAQALGINDLGQITGEATTDLEAKHAFIWLPVPFDPYNLSRPDPANPGQFLFKGMFDIGPGPLLSSQSIGRDINEAGFITGQRIFDPVSNFKKAFLWDPTDTAQLSFLRMDNLFDLDAECVVCPAGNPCSPPPGEESTSVGLALNDLLPIPYTAGSSGYWTGIPGQSPNHGYFDALPGGDSKLDLHLKPDDGGQFKSVATALTTPLPGDTPLIVGYTIGGAGEAGANSTPVFWESFDPAAACVAALPFADFSLEESAAPIDLNEQKNIVGFDCNGFGGVGPPGSTPRALFWESHNDTRFALPEVPSIENPPGSPLTSLRARSLNNNRTFNGQQLLQVVGWDSAGPPTSVTHGVLWERIGPPNPNQDNWTAVNLNADTMTNRGSDGNGGPFWSITGAYDINNTDEGWITGVARRSDFNDLPGVNFDRAVLLSPLGDCPEDNMPRTENTSTGTIAVGNGTVNIDDLVGVLNGFGVCPSGEFCWADINGNFVVNIDDLVAVLNAFGPTACAGQLGSGSLALQITDISNDFTVGFPDAQGNIIPSPMVAAAWAAQQSTVPLSVYRLWAVVDENVSLSYAGGGVSSGANGASEPLVLSAGKGAQFFIANNDYSSSVNVALLDVNGGAGFEWFQSQAWATHLFMGGTSGPTIFGDFTALNAILTGAVNTPDSGWGVIGSVAGQPDGNGGWRVLIGQFAVPHGSAFTAAVRLTGDGIDTYATINSTSQVLSP